MCYDDEAVAPSWLRIIAAIAGTGETAVQDLPKSNSSLPVPLLLRRRAQALDQKRGIAAAGAPRRACVDLDTPSCLTPACRPAGAGAGFDQPPLHGWHPNDDVELHEAARPGNLWYLIAWRSWSIRSVDVPRLDRLGGSGPVQIVRASADHRGRVPVPSSQRWSPSSSAKPKRWARRGCAHSGAGRGVARSATASSPSSPDMHYLIFDPSVDPPAMDAAQQPDSTLARTRPNRKCLARNPASSADAWTAPTSSGRGQSPSSLDNEPFSRRGEPSHRRGRLRAGAPNSLGVDSQASCRSSWVQTRLRASLARWPSFVNSAAGGEFAVVRYRVGGRSPTARVTRTSRSSRDAGCGTMNRLVAPKGVSASRYTLKMWARR